MGNTIWRTEPISVEKLLDDLRAVSYTHLVSQSEANCRQVEASLLDLRQQVKEVENSLSILLGDVPGTRCV